MSQEYKLEVPDFAAGLTRQLENTCDECFNKAQDPICNIATGRTVGEGNVPNSPDATCTCHDICVQEVTHIATCVIKKLLPYPPVGRCRVVLPQGSTFPPLPPNTIGQVVVTCAEEDLDPSCSSITVTVGLMVVFPVGQSAIAIPTIVTCTANAFNTYDFETCTLVNDPEKMREIISKTDGSCIKVVFRAVSNAAGDAICLEGKIIDKLWRHENLWVMAVQPYPDIPNFSQFTIKTEFNTFNHAIGDCTSPSCP